jgi:ubiquinone biosynthesis protein COQ9
LQSLTVRSSSSILNVHKISDSNQISTRCLSTQTSVLFDKATTTDIESFRAREEKKEEEFNKLPATTEEEQKKDESHEEKEDPEIVEIKSKILEASLSYVHELGWKQTAIIKGAEQIGYPGTVHGLFPRGGVELINYFYLKCNKELITQMIEHIGDKEQVENPKEFVCWAIKQRLQMIEPFIKQWPQALAILTLPPNVPSALANQLTLVDDICYYSGDRSVDVSKLKLQV